jgi:hypothetical protein
MTTSALLRTVGMLLASLALAVTSAQITTAEVQSSPTSAGSVSDLMIDRSGVDLLLSWNSDCGLGDTNGIYRGSLALGYSSIAMDTCDVAATQATIPEGAPDGEFFLVVPTWNFQEGSYGSLAAGDRAPAPGTCHPQGPLDECVACAVPCDEGETCVPNVGCIVDFNVQAENLLFTDDLVTGLWLFVAPEWLDSDDVSLEIEISGINAGFHEHGFQEILVSATQVIFIDQVDALVEMDWTTDLLTTHSPETYTVCIQPMVNGQAFGNNHCGDFER